MDIYVNTQNRDLGGVARDIQAIINGFATSPGRGSHRAQGPSTNDEFIVSILGLGIIAAIIFVYLLMALNFQSWSDPFVILMALPGAFAGIAWVLFLTQTTLSVPALMGAIMTMGVATANSILVVTFANDARGEGKSAIEAALEAGHTRLRPVCMTALAMILGMLPMALALGQGGEQNAPDWASRDRRTSVCHRRYALHCADHLLAASQASADRFRQAHRRRDKGALAASPITMNRETREVSSRNRIRHCRKHAFQERGDE